MLVYKWLPGPFGFAMLLSFSTLVLVSLLTKPEDRRADGEILRPDAALD